MSFDILDFEKETRRAKQLKRIALRVNLKLGLIWSQRSLDKLMKEIK